MNFEMVGKISLGKDTDKFHPFEVKNYDASGWTNKTIRFNAICGDNRHMLQVKAGAYSDGHGDVYTFTKSYVGADGNKVKGEAIQIPFKDRLTSDRIPEVADFKKFVFDLEKPKRRYLLEKAVEKIKEGTSITDEEMNAMDVSSEADITAELEKSKKKHHEFISEWDYVDFIKRVIDSGKYADKKFRIRGSVDYSYSDDKQRVYENYIPNRIYLAADDDDEYSTGTVNVLFGVDSLDELSVNEKGKYYVNGWHMEYEQKRKADIPVPITIAIPMVEDDKGKKRTEAIKRKFVVSDDKIYEYGITVNMINGAQKVEITEDMLTDEQKDDIECGLITLDDIRADLGGSVYGDRIQEFQFVKPARGWTKGRADTVYTMDDMVIKPIEEELPDEVQDLFDDDEDL